MTTRSRWAGYVGLPLLISLSFVAERAPAAAQPTSAQSTTIGASQQPTGSPDSVARTEQKITAYTLPPDLYRKAHNLRQIAFWSQLAGVAYSVIAWLLLLRWRMAPRFRDWAERTVSMRFVQAALFAPALVLTFDTLSLPQGLFRQWVLRRYGLSIQAWGSWFWDWVKGECVACIAAAILVWVLYAVIRRSPRRWWLYFWAVAFPLGILFFFLQPTVIDPLFNRFEPLARKNPSLTASLEQMVQRAGQDIPPDRMFWMGASDKLTVLNAYVTGIGATKRIVVWDTTLSKMTAPQIVFVVGHEVGHYVLQHIWKGLAFFGALFFVFFYLVFRSIGWVLMRWGTAWGIRDVHDWASLPVLLLLLTILAFVANPVANAFSRYIEHEADQYSLEVTHGLTPDAGQTGAQAFQVLGEVGLSDPDPGVADIFLFYDHPAIRDRVRFSLTYDPWSRGEQPEFVK